MDNKEIYDLLISEASSEWLELLSEANGRKPVTVHRIEPFILKNVHKRTTILLPCKAGSKIYLVSPDLSVRKDVTESEIDFSEVARVPGISFLYDPEDGDWVMEVTNPYVQVV